LQSNSHSATAGEQFFDIGNLSELMDCYAFHAWIPAAYRRQDGLFDVTATDWILDRVIQQHLVCRRHQLPEGFLAETNHLPQRSHDLPAADVRDVTLSACRRLGRGTIHEVRRSIGHLLGQILRSDPMSSHSDTGKRVRPAEFIVAPHPAPHSGGERGLRHHTRRRCVNRLTVNVAVRTSSERKHRINRRPVLFLALGFNFLGDAPIQRDCHRSHRDCAIFFRFEAKSAQQQENVAQ
jgi:hypothetical protein